MAQHGNNTFLDGTRMHDRVAPLRQRGALTLAFAASSFIKREYLSRCA